MLIHLLNSGNYEKYNSLLCETTAPSASSSSEGDRYSGDHKRVDKLKGNLKVYSFMKDFLRRKFLNSHRRHQTHCQQKSEEQQHHHHQSPTKNKRVVLSSDCGGDGDEEESYYNSTEEDIYVEVCFHF